MKKNVARIMCAVMALALLLALLPAAFVSAATNTYVLDTTADLQAFDKLTKADGATEKAGTDGFFTIHYSANTKVDSSKKTFEDNYAATQRLNFGGKVAFNQKNDDGTTYHKNVIEINPTGAATVKIWWVANKAGREMGIFNASGEVLKQTSVSTADNAMYISELSVAEAGKYFIGCTSTDGCNYIFKIEVTIAAEPETPACRHTNTKVEGAKDATCTVAGFTGNTVCTDCGEKVADGREIPVLDHTYVDGKCTCGAEDPNYVPPVDPEQPIDPTGDYTFMFFALLALSMSALVVLISKKRAF